MKRRRSSRRCASLYRNRIDVEDGQKPSTSSNQNNSINANKPQCNIRLHTKDVKDLRPPAVALHDGEVNAILLMKQLASKVKVNLVRLPESVIKKYTRPTKPPEDNLFAIKTEGKVLNISHLWKHFCTICKIVQDPKNKKRQCQRCESPTAYECISCDTRYGYNCSVVYHIKKKLDPHNPFKCFQCEYTHPMACAVEKHANLTHIDPDLRKCTRCKKQFTLMRFLKKHSKKCGRDDKLGIGSKIRTKNPTGRKRKAEKEHKRKNKRGRRNNKRDDFNPIDDKLKFNMTTFSNYTDMIKRYCSKCRVKLNNLKNCPDCKEKIMYQCVKCSKESTCLENIKYHLDSKCYPLMTYNCRKCEYSTTIRMLMFKHLRRVHSSNRNIINGCSICGRQFQSRIVLQQHRLICNKKFVCKYCPFMTKFKSNLKIHLRRHLRRNRSFNHGDTDNELNQSLSTECKETLDENSAGDTNSVNKQPDLTEKSLEDDSEFTVTATKPGAPNLLRRYCSVCSKDIQDNKRACSSCNSTIIFECKTCKKNYTNFESAKYHIQNACYSSKWLNCTKCDFASPSRSIMTQHNKSVHTVVKQKAKLSFDCKTCNSRFRTLGKLKYHVMKCGKKPKTETTFEVTIRNCLNIHSDDTKENDSPNDLLDNDQSSQTQKFRIADFTDRYCQKCKAVTSNSGANAYCQTCYTLLEYRCKKCEKVMEFYGKAVYHVNMCIQPKQYQCPKCEFVCSIVSNLRRHLAAVHNISNTKCSFCNKENKSVKYLRRHMIRCKRRIRESFVQ